MKDITPLKLISQTFSAFFNPLICEQKLPIYTTYHAFLSIRYPQLEPMFQIRLAT